MKEALPMLELRPEVAAFAQLMEFVLRQNDHKGGWQDCPTDWLFKRLQEEVEELHRELNPPRERCGCREAGCPHVPITNLPLAAKEAVDVTNIAMMLVDKIGLLHGPLPGWKAAGLPLPDEAAG